MRFIRGFVVGTLLLLVFCSVMVIREFAHKDEQHIEKRESFLLLVKKGFNEEANRYYANLLLNLDDVSDETLVDDMQRAAMVVDPEVKQTDNLVWRFYWSINNEVEKRAQKRLSRVLEKVETK